MMGESLGDQKFTMNTSAIFNGLETAEFNAIDPNVRVLATQGLCSNRMISLITWINMSQPPDYMIHPGGPELCSSHLQFQPPHSAGNMGDAQQTPAN